MRDDGDFERLFLWILCACFFILVPKLHVDLIAFEKLSIERNEEEVSLIVLLNCICILRLMSALLWSFSPLF